MCVYVCVPSVLLGGWEIVVGGGVWKYCRSELSGCSVVVVLCGEGRYVADCISKVF